MSVAETLAWIGTALGIGRAVPQLAVVYRERDLSGLSVRSCMWLLVTSLWWDVYAIALLDAPLIASSVGASIAPVLIWYKLTARNLTTRRDQIQMIPAVLAALVALLGGVTTVGMLASGLTLFYAVPQFVQLLRTRDVTGVSLTTWALTAVNTTIWAVYGLLSGNIPVMLPALVLLPTAGLVVGLHLRNYIHRQVRCRTSDSLTTTGQRTSDEGHDAPADSLRHRRAVALLAGWLLIACAIVMLVRAQLGVAPYDVLNTALAAQLGTAPGTASWLACAVLVLLAALLGTRAGIGTLVGAFVVGGLINVGLAAVPEISALPLRVGLFVCALGVMYTGICGIIVSNVGAGPTELVTLGLMRRGASVRTARWSVEAGCLVVGGLLGGSFGVGTLVIMVVSGPALAYMLPRAGALVRGAERALLAAETAPPDQELGVMPA